MEVEMEESPRVGRGEGRNQGVSRFWLADWERDKIMKLVGYGLNTADIAARMGCSRGQVTAVMRERRK